MDRSIREEELRELCYGVPKAELHLHIEGTLDQAVAHNIRPKNFAGPEVNLPSHFESLSDFLAAYYANCKMLLREEDISILMQNYMRLASEQGVVYAEVFFDPQTHTERGVSMEKVVRGLLAGIKEGRKKHPMEVKLILCILRHLSEEEAIKTIEASAPFKEHILALGLDSAEQGNPPEKFAKAFAIGKKMGYRLTCHAGEETNAGYIRNALEKLHVERIDHGLKVVEDEALMTELAEKKIGLTCCPFSNVASKNIKSLKDFPIRKMLEKKIIAMINSDDPAYMCGYVGLNLLELAKAQDLKVEEVQQLAENSFLASFMPTEAKEKYIAQVRQYVAKWREKVTADRPHAK